MIFKREPVLWQGLVLATLNLLIVFGVIDVTEVQLGAINVFVAAVLGFIVRSVVTPLARPRNSAGEDLVPAALPSTADPG